MLFLSTDSQKLKSKYGVASISGTLSWPGIVYQESTALQISLEGSESAFHESMHDHVNTRSKIFWFWLMFFLIFRTKHIDISAPRGQRSVESTFTSCVCAFYESVSAVSDSCEFPAHSTFPRLSIFRVIFYHSLKYRKNQRLCAHVFSIVLP